MYHRSDYAAASHSNTNMRPAPHVAAIRIDTSVLSDEISQRDLLVADDLAAHDPFSDIMELFTARNYAGLSRLRSLNRIGSGYWTGSSSDYANADLHFSPHARTIVLDGRIPPHEVCKRYLLVAVHLIASYTLGYLMELVAVGNYPGLS
jgi:hypothetical protein